MPSAEHEELVTLFERAPAFAAELLALSHQGLGPVPKFAEARIESSNLSQLDPAAFHADAVVVLRDRKGKAILALVVEVQRQVVTSKRFTWMVYVASVAARYRCPADLLVLTLEARVSRCARRALTAVRRMSWSPIVVGPEEVPQVTDVEEAKRSPERALLSLMVHARSVDQERLVRLGYAAVQGLEVAEPSLQDLYSRIIGRVLRTEGARALEAFMESRGEKLDYFSRKAEQAAKAAAKTAAIESNRKNVLRLLELRFGQLSEDQRRRIERAEPEEIDRFFTLGATATSLSEVLD